MVSIVSSTCIIVDLAHHEIFHAKVDKGGIRMNGAGISYFSLNENS